MKKLDIKALNPLGVARILGERKHSHPVKPPALPPGTLIYVGQKRIENTTIEVVEYDLDRVTETSVDQIEDCAAFVDTRPITWLRVTGLHDIERIGAIGKAFGIHPLVLEDVLNTNQRGKVEEFDGYLFVVSTLLQLDGKTDELDIQHCAMVVLPRTVITFLESPTPVFEPVLERIRKGNGRIRGAAEDYLAWAALDAVVDNYFGVIDAMDTRLGALDDQLQDSPEEVEAHTLFAIKREISQLHHLIRPIREVGAALQRADSKLITDQARPFFRDLYDHAIHAIERMEDLRETASSLRDFYLAAAGNRMNEIMKVLTIFATFFMPITFLAGIYGMNFEVMPELKFRWAYPALWGVFVAVAVAMVCYFRRKRWM